MRASHFLFPEKLTDFYDYYIIEELFLHTSIQSCHKTPMITKYLRLALVSLIMAAAISTLIFVTLLTNWGSLVLLGVK